MKTLTENQKLCYDHLKKTSESGIGCASLDMVKGIVQRIEKGEMSEGEWFALEFQLLGVVKAMETRS